MPAAPRLKIGLSACFQHADPARPLFTGKTLQYVEQSIAHWLMSAGAMVVMVPCPTGETARGDVTLDHYAEWLDGIVMHGGADVWPGAYGRPDLVYPGAGYGHSSGRDPRRVDWCRWNYRSYNPSTGYYRAYSGRLVYCG